MLETPSQFATHHRPRLVQLRSIIWRWSELFQYFPSHACCRLLHPNNRRVAKVTLNKEHHLFIAHQHIIPTYTVQPPLYRSFDSRLVFVCTGTCRREAGRHSRDKGFRIGRNEVLRELDELGVCTADVAELCSSELGKVGLLVLVLCCGERSRHPYIDVKADDWVFSASPLQRSDFGL